VGKMWAKGPLDRSPGIAETFADYADIDRMSAF